METATILDWANAVCQEASDAKQKGDMGPLNAIGRNPILKYYFENVFSIKALSPQVFGSYHNYMTEMERLYEADMKERETDLKLAETEAANIELRKDVTDLKEQVAALLAKFEAQTAPAKSKKPAKTEEAPDEEAPAESE